MDVAAWLQDLGLRYVPAFRDSEFADERRHVFMSRDVIARINPNDRTVACRPMAFSPASETATISHRPKWPLLRSMPRPARKPRIAGNGAIDCPDICPAHTQPGPSRPHHGVDLQRRQRIA
jgi:hypothetical protein